MARNKKAPEKLHTWYRVQESGGKGRHRRTWDVTIPEIRHGMSFEDLRREMDQIEADHGSEFEKFRIEPQDEYEYGDNQSYQVFYVEGLRWETDEEYNARMGEAARIIAAREERERKQYEALAKKFAAKN